MPSYCCAWPTGNIAETPSLCVLSTLRSSLPAADLNWHNGFVSLCVVKCHFPTEDLSSGQVFATLIHFSPSSDYSDLKTDFTSCRLERYDIHCRVFTKIWHVSIRNYGHFIQGFSIFRGSTVCGQLSDKHFHGQVWSVPISRQMFPD